MGVSGYITTSTLLLESLRSPENRAAWETFDARYRPILIGLGRKLGLSDDDTDEAAQRTLVAFVGDYRAGKFDREKGRLRTWILGIAKHRILDLHRERQRTPRAGDTVIEGLSDERHITALWDAEHERVITQRAWEELAAETRTHDRTLAAFEAIAVRGEAAADVARRFELEVAEVYRIKSRLTQQLREIVARLEAAYEMDS